MQSVYDIHKIVARIGLLDMLSQAHHEVSQRKHQRLVQRQHRMVLKHGGINPLDRLSLLPIWITRPHLAGEEEEYDLSIAGKSDRHGVADTDAQLFLQFTTERLQRRLPCLDLPTGGCPETRMSLPLWSLLDQDLAATAESPRRHEGRRAAR